MAGDSGVGDGSRCLGIGAAVEGGIMEAGVLVARSLAAELQALIANTNVPSDNKPIITLEAMRCSFRLRAPHTDAMR